MSHEKIIVPGSLPPIVSVIVHTEEEFDWAKGVDQYATGVSHIKKLDIIQSVFEKHGVLPLYVVDYPVANQEEPVSILKKLLDSGKAEIGTHLQPWVSPPFTEQINDFNSYPGNLPYELELEKLAFLSNKIEEMFLTKPTCYLAGRYGVGENTHEILKKLGYLIDLSASPPYDYRVLGGPDFSRISCHPAWTDNSRSLLSLPGTGAFTGALHRAGPAVYKHISTSPLDRLRLTGIAARLDLLDRLRLSPEGFELRDLKRLTKFLTASGLRYFTFSFHSPSIVPGNTGYVKTESDLEQFVERVDAYLSYFLGELGGVTRSPFEFREMIVNSSW